MSPFNFFFFVTGTWHAQSLGSAGLPPYSSRRRKVLVLDAGSLTGAATGRDRNSEASHDQRPHAQNAWGWHRRYSLQPKAMMARGCDPSDVGFDGVNLNRGPMLVSTKRDGVVDRWKG